MIEYSLIDKADGLLALSAKLNNGSFSSIAMDFEEESNLHVYGEHLCLIQLFDGKEYYVVDVVKILQDAKGCDSIKEFLESPVEKIMFDCSSDASIVRKSLNIQLKNIFDIRLLAKAVGFMGNLTSLIERNLSVVIEDPALKKKYQRANWIKRPLSEEQIQYGLSDVKFLFDLKDSLLKEINSLPESDRKRISTAMRSVALPKHKEKPGWEKICNYKKLNREQKIYLRHFFLARDALAKKANMPPTNIVEKQLIVEMANRGTWKGVLDKNKIRYSGVFEQARLAAINEISN